MLDVNQIAPDFSLPQLGNGEFRFYESASKNSLLIFYKFSCGTSRFTFPFLQKIYEAYGDTLNFAAIAQDEAEASANFRDDLGITIPILLDMNPYPVSRAFGIHTVPSIFFLDANPKILFTSYGFVKQDILNLADILAEKSVRPQIEVFDSVEVPEIKPG